MCFAVAICGEWRILGLSFLERQEFLLAVEKWTGIMEMKCNIKTLRKKAGFTQKEFADLLQTSVSHVSRLETGKHLPSLPVAYRIAKILYCLIEDLYNFES